MNLRIWISFDESPYYPLRDTLENLCAQFARYPQVEGIKVRGPVRSHTLRSSVYAICRPRFPQRALKAFVDGKAYGTSGETQQEVDSARVAGASYATIAAVTGQTAMKAAKARAHGMELIAVTVPTTQPDEETMRLHNVGCRFDAVRMLAEDSMLSGLSNIVCAGKRDLPNLLKDSFFKNCSYWIPGIRPHWAIWIPKETEDQIHTVSHVELMEIVGDADVRHILGRPMLLAPNPLKALEQYLKDCGE